MVLRERAHLARTHGDAVAAAKLFTEARQEFEAIGDRHGQARCLNGLGEVARQLGRLEVARSAYARASEAFRTIGARNDLATSLANLGLTELADGNLDAAEEYLAEAATLSAKTAHPYITLGISTNLNLVRARRGDWESILADAAKLLSDLDAFDYADPDYGDPLEEMAKLAMEAGHDQLAVQLGERAFHIKSSLDDGMAP